MDNLPAARHHLNVGFIPLAPHQNIFLTDYDRNPLTPSTCLSYQTSSKTRIIRSLHVYDLLHRPFVSLHSLKLVYICPQFRMLLFRECRATSGGTKWEAHQNIGSCQLSSAKVFSAIWGAGDLAFHERELCLEIRMEKFGLHCARDHRG